MADLKAWSHGARKADWCVQFFILPTILKTYYGCCEISILISVEVGKKMGEAFFFIQKEELKREGGLDRHYHRQPRNVLLCVFLSM